MPKYNTSVAAVYDAVAALQEWPQTRIDPDMLPRLSVQLAPAVRCTLGWAELMSALTQCASREAQGEAHASCFHALAALTDALHRAATCAVRVEQEMQRKARERAAADKST